MGKLRFTLTNLLFWVIMLMIAFVSEFFLVYGAQSLPVSSSVIIFIMSFLIIGLMVVYYLLEHKKNQMKIDWVLLPALIIFSGLMIWTIFRQGDRTFLHGSNETIVAFTTLEKLTYSLEILVWMSSLYMVFYIHNRFGFNNTYSKIVAKLILIIVLGCILIDFIYERDVYAAILSGDYSGYGTHFIIFNSNIWAMILLFGMCASLVLLQDKFNWFYFLSIPFIFIASLFSKSTTTILAGFFTMIFTFAFEFFYYFAHSKKKLLIGLGISVVSLAIVVGLSILFYKLNVPLFVNAANYFLQTVAYKDFVNYSGRVYIWRHIIDLMKQNPLDLIFGLGYRTGNKILAGSFSDSEYLRSAHNGVMEIFLRHGLLGATIYFLVGLISFLSFITYIRHKQPRKAFVYATCFACLTAHNFTESTTLFTPNLQGALLTAFLILPLFNTLKQKKLDVLKKDILSIDLKGFNPNEKGMYNLATYIGLGILVACLSVIDLNKLVIYITLVTAVLWIAIMLIQRFNHQFSFKKFFKETIVAATVALVVGLIGALIIKQGFVINLFYSILLLIVVFSVYLAILLLCNKGLLKYANDYGLFFYQRMTKEDDYR